jgi:hypothetical protein
VWPAQLGERVRWLLKARLTVTWVGNSLSVSSTVINKPKLPYVFPPYQCLPSMKRHCFTLISAWKKNQHSGSLNDWAAQVSSKTVPKNGTKVSQSKDLSTLHSSVTAFSKANTSVTSLSMAEKSADVIVIRPPITLDDSVAGIDLFADNIDETQECLAALMSPPKGKKHLTSNVSDHFFTVLQAYIVQTIVKIEDNEAPL